MTFLEVLCSILVITGSLFMFIACVGILRFPDFYIRNSAVSKASTLGVFLILLGVGIYFDSLVIFLEIIAIIYFILLISPTGAYIIARSALKNKVPFWYKTNLKDLDDPHEIVDEDGEKEK